MTQRQRDRPALKKKYQRTLHPSRSQRTLSIHARSTQRRSPARVSLQAMPRVDALPCLVLGTLALFTGAASLLHRTTGRGAGGGFGLYGGGGGGAYGGPGGGVNSLQWQHRTPPHEGRHGARRALRQIARESEQVPFEFLPGTSGPAPNYWMLRDAHREIPAAIGARPCLHIIAYNCNYQQCNGTFSRSLLLELVRSIAFFRRRQ